MNVVNEFYIGLYLQMYQIWKHQGKTIQDSGYVIKGNIIHQDNFCELYTTLHPTFLLKKWGVRGLAGKFVDTFAIRQSNKLLKKCFV